MNPTTLTAIITVCIVSPLLALVIVARRLDAMRQRKDDAYLERNRVVALLARVLLMTGHRVGLKKTSINGWSDDWHNCVYMELPTGQASWHYNDEHAHLFAGLPPYQGEWDGHLTPAKYERVHDAFQPSGEDIYNLRALVFKLGDAERATSRRLRDMEIADVKARFRVGMKVGQRSFGALDGGPGIVTRIDGNMVWARPTVAIPSKGFVTTQSYVWGGRELDALDTPETTCEVCGEANGVTRCPKHINVTLVRGPRISVAGDTVTLDIDNPTTTATADDLRNAVYTIAPATESTPPPEPVSDKAAQHA